jgi:hypothetical protein
MFSLPVPGADDYILEVMPPMILVVMRVDVARVWLNDTLIYEFVCNEPGEQCLPAITRVGIPPYLLMEDLNRIQILVEGSGHALLNFAILRASGWPNWR